MSAIAAWITNIILVIIFAVILELILPNSSMQRYVKLVVGLMLLMIMLQPVLSIFQIDSEEWLDEIIFSEADATMSQTNSLQFQKKDIQLDNLAYISEYMAEQLTYQASAQLEEKYEVMLEEIEVEFKEYKDLQEYETEKDLIENLSFVGVYLKHLNQGEGEEENIALVVIEPVEILNSRDIEPERENKNDLLSEEIRTLLSDIWGIPENKLQLQMKGGEE